ncbi:hypothetical protein CP8484711_2331A, partial [Chlamydia psittaci 84-8471/1]
MIPDNNSFGDSAVLPISTELKKGKSHSFGESGNNKAFVSK